MLEYSEFIKYKEKIEKISVEYDIFIRKFLLKQALDLMRKTKQKTPTDTGLLKTSFQIEDIEKKGNYIRVTLINPVEYASYVEYGHTQQIGKYVPKIGKRLKKGWTDGKFMLTLSVKEIKEKIPKRYEDEFKKWIKEMGFD